MSSISIAQEKGKERIRQRKQEAELQSSRRCLTVGTWNVHTLVESMGDERVCRKVNKPGNHRNDHGMVDWKLDPLVRELKRYGISIAGIQETKCLEVMCGLLMSTPFNTLVVPCQVIKKEQLGMRVSG